jgi:hypothetical protein
MTKFSFADGDGDMRDYWDDGGSDSGDYYRTLIH